MRKTLLTASLLLLALSPAFAQKSLVNKAWSQAKLEEPNFKQARADIQEALANEETVSDAKTWYVAGDIEQRFFDKENSQLQLGLSAKENEMYNALSNEYKYYLKAVALDTLPNKKGKVKPKYLKNIRRDLLANSDGYIQGGVYYFNQKEYQKLSIFGISSCKYATFLSWLPRLRRCLPTLYMPCWSLIVLLQLCKPVIISWL